MRDSRSDQEHFSTILEILLNEMGVLSVLRHKHDTADKGSSDGPSCRALIDVFRDSRCKSYGMCLLLGLLSSFDFGQQRLTPTVRNATKDR